MLRRFNPFEDFSSIFRGFDNLFRQAFDFEGAPQAASGLLTSGEDSTLPAHVLAGSGRWTHPAVESFRRGNQIVLRAELPGVDPKDLDMSVVDNHLILRGEKRQERQESDSDTYFREISYGRFERSFTLPRGVKPEQVNARFENGVLEVTLPATALEDAGRKVPIQIGSGEADRKAVKSA